MIINGQDKNGGLDLLGNKGDCCFGVVAGAAKIIVGFIGCSVDERNQSAELSNGGNSARKGGNRKG